MPQLPFVLVQKRASLGTQTLLLQHWPLGQDATQVLLEQHWVPEQFPQS
jgi:hypothetical protein